MRRTRFYNALHRVAGGRIRSNYASRALYISATLTSFFDAPLAAQVGEDAYFIRENAMGVADGVGRWAENCNRTENTDSEAMKTIFGADSSNAPSFMGTALQNLNILKQANFSLRVRLAVTVKQY
ncbi:hypothetical protein B0H11DRAFT_1909585 [Mycena galericulata]|nr:hypothetical protein B0H11DRAFT_1909585 [Mycena galericulata]